jgi:hypothetical protein
VSADEYVTVLWTNLMTPSSGLMSGQNVRRIYLSTCHYIPEPHVSVLKTWCSGQIYHQYSVLCGTKWTLVVANIMPENCLSWLLHKRQVTKECGVINIISCSLSLHRALRRVTWSAHQPMHTLKLFTLKLLKTLRHVSIIRSSSGSCLFLAKITLLKTFTAWFSYNNFVMWQHVMLCRSSDARSAPDCVCVVCYAAKDWPHHQIIIRKSSSECF